MRRPRIQLDEKDIEEIKERDRQQIDDERKMVLITIATIVIGSFIIWLLLTLCMEASKWVSTLD